MSNRTPGPYEQRLTPFENTPSLLAALMTESQDLVVLIDQETRIHQASDSWNHGFGDAQRLSAVLEEGSVPKLMEALNRIEPWTRPVHLDLRDRLGDYRRVAFSRVRVGGLYMLIGRDLEDRQALLSRVMEMHHLSLRRSAELRRLANTDPLTGVSNRREVWKNARWIWANSTMATVALLDLDKFKKINDVFGHEVGDSVLQAVAESLTKAVSHGAVVGRWGGEEFVAIFEGDASGRAEDILKAIRNTRVEGAHPDLRISASLGMAVAPDTSITIADAVAAADSAMYTAKAAGGDRMVIRHLQPRDSSIPPAENDRRHHRNWR